MESTTKPLDKRDASLGSKALAMLPVLLGVAAFLLVLGPSVLKTSNLGWLGTGDPATHFLGWQIFRSSPWDFPLGSNPRYGLEFGVSILFSDSIPLVAILLKLLSPILPAHFQYFGIWLLACFVLQAWFSWKLLGLFIEDRTVRLLACAFFVFSPPMLWRMHGHLSLSGHFLITAALYLYLRPVQSNRLLAWSLLLVATAGIHAYLLLMVAALWAASLATMAWRTLRSSGRWRPLLVEVVGIAVLLPLACWQFGYFAVGSSISSGGYGAFRLNILGPVNPLGWSKVMAVQGQAAGDYEGFSFLGLGLICVGLFGLPALFERRVGIHAHLRRHFMLVACLVVLTLFAITNRVAFGLDEYTFEVSPWLISAANTFRASGRVFWPVYYAIMLGLLLIVARAYPVRAVRVLFALAIVVQVVDTGDGWRPLAKRYRAAASERLIPSPLVDPFWKEAAGHYANVRLITPANIHPNWLPFADYAAMHGMGTNATYLARIDDRHLIAAIERANRSVETGEYQADTLYILDEDQLLPALVHVSANTDLIARIDGFNVIAPGWKDCQACRQPPSEMRAETLIGSLKPVAIGERIDFALPSGAGRFLLSGFWTPEASGTWSKGTRASMLFVVAGPMPTRLVVEASAFILPNHPQQDVTFSFNGGPPIRVKLTRSNDNVFELPLPVPLPTAKAGPSVLTVDVASLNPARPVDLGLNSDSRSLSLGVVSVTLR